MAIKLNLGSGIGLLGGFINVDACLTREMIEEGFRTKTGPCRHAVIQPGAEFVQADIRKLPFDGNYADYVLMNNVIEHLPLREVVPALTEVLRVMKPDAELIVMTPDFNCLARLWNEHIGSQVGSFNDWPLFFYLAEVVYGNQTGIGEYHSIPMTPDFLRHCLDSAGFERITLEIYPMGQKTPEGIDGVEFSPTAINRTDNLIARAYKAAAAPEALAFCVGDRTAVKGGLA